MDVQQGERAGTGRSGRQLSAKSRFRVERLKRDAVAYAIVERLARLRRVSLRELLQGKRGSENAALTRQAAMYLVHVLLSRPQDTVALMFDRERTTVSHACAVVEQLRDSDAALDADIRRIEDEGWGDLAVPRTGRHVA
jgi:chromosomal replication initiation ATPase DnaA